MFESGRVMTKTLNIYEYAEWALVCQYHNTASVLKKKGKIKRENVNANVKETENLRQTVGHHCQTPMYRSFPVSRKTVVNIDIVLVI